MPKAKAYVCGYTFCKHSGEKVSSDIAVKDGTRYYHPDCHKEKETKKQIIDIYCKYYHSTEDYKVITKAINNIVNEQKIDALFVLYVLCQCIKEKVPFKGIFSLGWQVKNNMVYKKKYEEVQTKAAVRKQDFSMAETVQADPPDGAYKKEHKRKTWEDVLFG